MLQSISIDIASGRKGGTSGTYFSRLNSFVFSATLPAEIVTRLSHPEQMLSLTESVYQSMIKAFCRNGEYPKSNRPYLVYHGFKYDAQERSIHLLSGDEIKPELPVFLQKIIR